MFKENCNVFNRECNFYCKNPVEMEQIFMKPKTAPREKQSHLLYQDLLQQLNPKHPLLALAQKLPWAMFEKEFEQFYATVGRAAKPIRLMVGLLLLKQIYNLSDERVVEAWVQNPYCQAFCGIERFQWSLPCAPSDLAHFRKRICQAQSPEGLWAAQCD